MIQKEKQGRTRINISVDIGIKERLDKIGRINQSYNDLIHQLVDYWEEGHHSLNK